MDSYLVCTVCKGGNGCTHHKFQIDAIIYTAEEGDLLWVTLYLVDPAYHREYTQTLKGQNGDRNPALERSLNLPAFVSLAEETLHVELREQTAGRNWICSDRTARTEDIPVSQITGCHNTHPGGLIYSKDWVVTVLADCKGVVSLTCEFLIESLIQRGFTGLVNPAPPTTILVVKHTLEQPDFANTEPENEANSYIPFQASRVEPFGCVRNELGDSKIMNTNSNYYELKGRKEESHRDDPNSVMAELSKSPDCSWQGS